MWYVRMVACVLLLIFSIVPVFASDEGMEVDSDVESSSDSQDATVYDFEADTVVVLNEIADNQEVMNQNIVYGVGAILLGSGLLLGFMSAKELCKIWIE